MGFLAKLGAGIGGGFVASTAQEAAQRSMGWGALGIGLDMGKDVAAGIGGYQQSRYAAKVASEGAGATRLAGSQAESVLKGKYTRLEASQKVAQAANGIDVNSKSAVAVRDATADVGALDAAMIHFNTSREAYAQDAQAALYKRAGKGALASGLLGSGVSFLSGASALGDKWAAFQREMG